MAQGTTDGTTGLCSLPNELTLVILDNLSTNDLWNGIRYVNHQLRKLSRIAIRDRWRVQMAQKRQVPDTALQSLESWQSLLKGYLRMICNFRPSCVDVDCRDPLCLPRSSGRVPQADFWNSPRLWNRAQAYRCCCRPEEYAAWMGVSSGKQYIETLAGLNERYVRRPGSNGSGGGELMCKSRPWAKYWGDAVSRPEVLRDMTNAVTAIELGFESVRKVQDFYQKLRAQGIATDSHKGLLWTMETSKQSDDIIFKAVCAAGKDHPELRLGKVVFCEDERQDLWPETARDEMRRRFDGVLAWLQRRNGGGLGDSPRPVLVERITGWLDDLIRHSLEVKLNLLQSLLRKAMVFVRCGRSPCRLP